MACQWHSTSPSFLDQIHQITTDLQIISYGGCLLVLYYTQTP